MFLALAGWGANAFAVEVVGIPWIWPFVFPVLLHTELWIFHGFGIVLARINSKCLRMTWKALVVFVTYDLHQTRAAGVFRFPESLARDHPSFGGCSCLLPWSSLGSVYILVLIRGSRKVTSTVRRFGSLRIDHIRGRGATGVTCDAVGDGGDTAGTLP